MAAAVCGVCSQSIQKDDLYKQLNDVKYHSACWNCAGCGKPLKAFSGHNGRFVCEDCLKDLIQQHGFNLVQFLRVFLCQSLYLSHGYTNL